MTIPDHKIQSLISTVRDTQYRTVSLETFGYDNNWLQSHGDEIFNYVKGVRKHWIDTQVHYIKQQLMDTANYLTAVREYFINPYYDFGIDGGLVFNAKLYSNGIVKDSAAASQNAFGMPWKTSSGFSFNPAIPQIFFDILPKKRLSTTRRFNFRKYRKHLIPAFAKYEVVNSYKYTKKLEDLAVLEFRKEIEGLNSKFQVITATEYHSCDSYLPYSRLFIKIVLRSKSALPNTELDFFLEEKGNKLYTQDSVLKKGDSIFNAIQNITYVREGLLHDTSASLHVYFMNGSSMNDKAAESFNGNPNKWKSADDWRDFIHRATSKGEKFVFDTTESMQQSDEYNCGCNFRLNRSFLNKGIYFTIDSEVGRFHSVWLLLPDKTLVLWHFDGTYIFNGNYIKSSERENSCLKFNLNDKPVK